MFGLLLVLVFTNLKKQTLLSSLHRFKVWFSYDRPDRFCRFKKFACSNHRRLCKRQKRQRRSGRSYEEPTFTSSSILIAFMLGLILVLLVNVLTNLKVQTLLSNLNTYIIIQVMRFWFLSKQFSLVDQFFDSRLNVLD